MKEFTVIFNDKKKTEEIIKAERMSYADGALVFYVGFYPVRVLAGGSYLDCKDETNIE